jgi:hypothetical protein
MLASNHIRKLLYVVVAIGVIVGVSQLGAQNLPGGILYGPATGFQGGFPVGTVPGSVFQCPPGCICSGPYILWCPHGVYPLFQGGFPVRTIPGNVPQCPPGWNCPR